MVPSMFSIEGALSLLMKCVNIIVHIHCCSGYLYLSSINALPSPASLIRLPELPTEKVTLSRL